MESERTYPDLPDGDKFLRELAEIREHARAICEECDKELARIETEMQAWAAEYDRDNREEVDGNE